MAGQVTNRSEGGLLWGTYHLKESREQLQQFQIIRRNRVMQNPPKFGLTLFNHSSSHLGHHTY